MTVARTVVDVLSGHVTLEVECIDRLNLNVYQPRLQYVNGAVWFFRGHRGASFASSALMDPITKEFVASVHRFARDTGGADVDFARGQRKDDVAHEYLAGFEAAGHDEGVLFVGRAQEKTPVFRTEKRRNQVTGASYPASQAPSSSADVVLRVGCVLAHRRSWRRRASQAGCRRPRLSPR